MFASNLHTHTRFSDGQNTMEDMVLTAIAKGFVSLGISDHAPLAHDDYSAMKPDLLPPYRAEFVRLREKYQGQIQLYLGLEWDSLAPSFDRTGLDYVIGSVHDMRDEAGRAHPLDWNTEKFDEALNCIAHGDIQVLVWQYYLQLIQMLHLHKPDILGHMNIIEKMNTDDRYFSPQVPWYRDICTATADAIAKTGCIVEVNTALNKLRPGSCYPSPELLALLHKREVPVTISSDAHQSDHLDFHFTQAVQLLKDVGYRQVKMLRNNSFVDISL